MYLGYYRLDTSVAFNGTHVAVGLGIRMFVDCGLYHVFQLGDSNPSPNTTHMSVVCKP